MGKESEFPVVNFFCGCIFREAEMYEEAKDVLARLFSALDCESAEFPFTATSYYDEEMGRPLFRRFFSFTELREPDILPDMKIETNRVEEESAAGDKRRINLDPGYLSLANVVIATTKNYTHRIPLRRGIYAHLEYVFQRQRLTPLAWTYPDFRTPSYIDFFCDLRMRYKRKLDESGRFRRPLGG